jgi:hypothetical protein
MRKPQTKRKSARRKKSTRRQYRGGTLEYKYYIAANIVNKSIFENVRSLLLEEFSDYKKTPFRYDDIHITMAYGPILKANTEPEIEDILPNISELEPAKHINDIQIKDISLFLRPDRIIVKAELQSPSLTRLKKQLESTYESIGTIAAEMQESIQKEEKDMKEKYPELYTPYDPTKWAHITLIALKPDTDIDIIKRCIERAKESMKGQPLDLETEYLYIVSKNSNKKHKLITI